MKRRTYLTTATVTTAGLVLAGCMGDEGVEDGPADEGNETDDETNETDDETNETDDENGEEEPEDESRDVEDGDGLIGTFDDFEDLEAWRNVTGSHEADSDRYYTGSQSVHLTPDDEYDQIRFRRELDEPIDVSEVTPGLAMTAAGPGTVLIQLQNDGNNYVEFSQRVGNELPMTLHNFGLTRIEGDPDPTQVMRLQVIFWFNDREQGDLWIDDFHFVPTPDPGAVMLQLRGGYESHYTEGLSVLEGSDLPVTAFIPTDRLRKTEYESGDRLLEDQVEALADAGWTIGSYSARGLRLADVDSSELESDVVGPIDWLEENGYEDGARFFAFPGSRYTEEAYELVKENYDLAFAGDGRSHGYATNPHLLPVSSSPDPDEATALLDWTARYGGITTIPFYRLEESESVEALAETASYAAELASAGELEVISPAEMADEYVY